VTPLLGFDLNGLWDFVAESDEGHEAIVKDLGIHGSLVRPLADAGRWIGGQQAALAPHGRGPGWGQIGAQGNRLFLLDLIHRFTTGNPSEEDSVAIQSFLETLVTNIAIGVFAVPDIPEYDEAVRDRFLHLLTRTPRLRSTLLWRPIAAMLGCLEYSSESRRFQPANGQSLAVLSLMDSGMQLADVKLICERDSGHGGELWVPERKRSGLQVCGSCAGSTLVRSAMRQIGMSLTVDEAVLSTSNTPWRVAVGEKPEFELLRLPDRSWCKLPADAGPMVLIRAVDVPDAFRARLNEADALLVEGPMASHVAWVDAVLHTVGWPADRPLLRAGKGLVAKGCLVAAERAQRGAPIYYDFLPQLEINALVSDKPKFVELVPKDMRLEGGKIYKGQAPEQFAIDKGTTQLTFYLFKQDWSQGRKAEVVLPEPAEAQHPIRVSVEQSPGQGHARVSIESDTFQPLRRKPLELDWSRMETVSQTREQLLAALVGKTGFAYPNAIPTPGHAVHWHPDHRCGDLCRQLKAYLGLPLVKGNVVDAAAHAALKRLRERFSRQENPKYVAERMSLICEEAQNRRALGSDGALPRPDGDFAVPIEAEPLLDAAIKKVGSEFQDLLALQRRRAEPQIITDIVGFATWCFWHCPAPIAAFLQELYEGKHAFRLHHILLREGLGRIVHESSQLQRYFAAVEAKLSVGGSLTSAEFAALSRVLGGCQEAAELLPTPTANRIMQETLSELDRQNAFVRQEAYKRKFKALLLMLAGLLRHRRARPSFIDPAEGIAGKKLVNALEEAKGKNGKFRIMELHNFSHTTGGVRAGHFARARRFEANVKILAELINQIHKKGSDPNIIIQINDLEDGLD